MHRGLFLLPLIFATGCTTSSTTLREPPPSLSPATTALLDGCEARRELDGLGAGFDVDVVCAEGLRLVIHRQAAALEPTWPAFAADEAVRRKTVGPGTPAVAEVPGCIALLDLGGGQ